MSAERQPISLKQLRKEGNLKNIIFSFDKTGSKNVTYNFTPTGSIVLVRGSSLASFFGLNDQYEFGDGLKTTPVDRIVNEIANLGTDTYKGVYVPGVLRSSESNRTCDQMRCYLKLETDPTTGDDVLFTLNGQKIYQIETSCLMHCVDHRYIPGYRQLDAELGVGAYDVVTTAGSSLSLAVLAVLEGNEKLYQDLLAAVSSFNRQKNNNTLPKPTDKLIPHVNVLLNLRNKGMAALDDIKFAVKAHNSKKVIITDHEDCGAFKTVFKALTEIVKISYGNDTYNFTNPKNIKTLNDLMTQVLEIPAFRNFSNYDNLASVDDKGNISSEAQVSVHSPFLYAAKKLVADSTKVEVETRFILTKESQEIIPVSAEARNSDIESIFTIVTKAINFVTANYGNQASVAERARNIARPLIGDAMGLYETGRSALGDLGKRVGFN